MIPVIARSKKIYQEAVFGSSVISAGIKTKDGYVYAISSRSIIEPEGSFYVSGSVASGTLACYVGDGFVNGKLVPGAKYDGAAPCYVCLRLVPPNGGDPKIVLRDTFGYNKYEYFHPVAAFSREGKIAQMVFSGLFYRARMKVPGFNWVHEISAA